MSVGKARQGYKLVKFLFRKHEEIPEDWEVTTPQNICEHVTKGTTPTTEGDEFVDEGIHLKAEMERWLNLWKD